jgi:hypothetical protein
VIFSSLAALACWYWYVYGWIIVLFFILFREPKPLFVQAAATLLLLPFLLPMIVEMKSSPSKYWSVGEDVVKLTSVDILNFFTPAHNNAFFYDLVKDLYPLYSHFTENVGYLTYTFLFFFLFSLRQKKLRRKLKRIYIFFLICLLFSIGPYARFQGRTLFPLPYYFIMKIVEPLRSPSRMMVLTYLFLSIISSCSFLSIAIGRKSGNYKVLLLFALTSVAFFIELFPSLRFGDERVSKVYYDLKELPYGAVVEKPFNNLIVYFATIHEKPITEGSISRMPPISWYWSRNEFLFLTSDIRANYNLTVTKKILEDVEDMKTKGIRYVLIHWDWIQPLEEEKKIIFVEKMKEVLGEKPIEYKDGPPGDQKIFLFVLY